MRPPYPERSAILDEHTQQTPRSVLYVPCSGFRDLPKGLKFLTPKPLALMKELISYYPKKDAVILDYFAGSAATAQAVYELNKEDKGTRSWIVIEEMKFTFDHVIVPRLKHFDKTGDFGIYEGRAYQVHEQEQDTFKSSHSKQEDSAWSSENSYSDEEQAFVREKVSELPADERKVIYLAFWKGLSEQEAAIALNLNLAKVRKLKEKAFASIRALYEQRFLKDKVLSIHQQKVGESQKENLACV